jgi:hypothetical protein
VIGQPVERHHAKRVWARDAWHLWSRWQRKLLSHTLAVYLCRSTTWARCDSPTSQAKPAHRVSYLRGLGGDGAVRDRTGRSSRGAAAGPRWAHRERLNSARFLGHMSCQLDHAAAAACAA